MATITKSLIMNATGSLCFFGAGLRPDLRISLPTSAWVHEPAAMQPVPDVRITVLTHHNVLPGVVQRKIHQVSTRRV
jgi:hypothetical protein